MEDNFYNDDFEKFLQKQVKHHKMFPSDRIWRNINNNLHHDYKWPALTIAAFAFLVATIAVSVYFSPGPNIFAIPDPLITQTKISNSLNSPLTSVVTNRKENTVNLAYTPNTLTRHSTQLQIVDDVLTASKEEVFSYEENLNAFVEKSTRTEQPTTALVISENEAKSSFHDPLQIVSNSLKTVEINAPERIDNEIEIPKPNLLNVTGQDNKSSLIAAINKPRSNKFSYQVYITPSVSYRKLREDKSVTMQQAANLGGPVALNYIAGINQVVRHTPGTGMEAGVAFGYQLNSKLKVKTGLQLNARQYAIEAYRYAVEVATITYLSGGVVDSVTAFSSYRTSNGFTSTELTNRYYQISVPLGIEYEVLGNQNVQLNVAASLQPTYMISRNAYLISSDYKNYIENPDMTRKWNMNANVETFISVKSGDFKWQLGPQLRYQTLPTSIKEYPIKEHLIDYGIKLGVIKNLR